jgi:hypothetical protein
MIQHEQEHVHEQDRTGPNRLSVNGFSAVSSAEELWVNRLVSTQTLDELEKLYAKCEDYRKIKVYEIAVGRKRALQALDQ